MDFGSLVQITSEVDIINEQKVLIIHFTGKITSDNILDINQKIKSLFESGIYNVILNISELHYLNSTGIAMLLTISKTIEQNSGNLILTQPSPFVQDLLEMTDLLSRFTIRKTIEESRALIATLLKNNI